MIRQIGSNLDALEKKFLRVKNHYVNVNLIESTKIWEEFSEDFMRDYNEVLAEFDYWAR